MNSSRYCNIFAAVIILLFFVFRIDDIGSTPKGFFCDEASIAYNARSILETGRDEHGAVYPLFFKAFGEYKPALYIYLGALVQPFFDDIHFSTRLPSAVFLAFAMLFTYVLLARMIHPACGIIAVFLMGSDPWLHHFSHVAFTLSAVPLILICAVMCFIKGVGGKQPWRILSLLLFLLAVYTYPPARMFVPLFLCSLIYIYRKTLLADSPSRISVLLHAVFFVLLLLPLGCYMLFVDGFLSRLDYLNILTSSYLQHSWSHKAVLNGLSYIPFLPEPDPQSLLVRILMAALHYLSYFSPNYLFFHGDSNPRFGTNAFGVFGWLTGVGFVIGLYATFKNRSELHLVFLFWLMLHALPASLTWENIPHGGRGILGHPAFDCVAAIGLWSVLQYVIGKYRSYADWPYAAIIASLLVIYSIHAKLFFSHYRSEYSVNASGWMQYGFRDMMEYIRENHSKYEETVIVSTLLLYQPYIFALLYSDLPAERWIQERKLPWNIKIYVHELKPEQWKENTLYVFSPTPPDLPAAFRLLQRFTWEDGVGESFSVYEYVP